MKIAMLTSAFLATTSAFAPAARSYSRAAVSMMAANPKGECLFWDDGNKVKQTINSFLHYLL